MNVWDIDTKVRDVLLLCNLVSFHGLNNNIIQFQLSIFISYF